MRVGGSVLGALSATDAALGLAWVAIVLIALAVAGLLRQVRELQAVLLEGFGRGFLTDAAPTVLQPRPGCDDAVVLAVEPTSVSQALVEAFAEAVRARGTRTEARLLSPVPMPNLNVPSDVTNVTDPKIVELLRVPWYPAVVHLGADGRVLDAAPVGSVDALKQALGRFDQPSSATR